MKNRSDRDLRWVGVLAWLAVPAAWGLAAVLERGRDWEGAPSNVWTVGWVALVVAGAAMVLTAVRTPGRTNSLRLAALVPLGLGLAVSAVAGWAIVVWAGLYGVGMIVLAAQNRGRPATWLLGAAFVGATIAVPLLTELAIGTRDSDGGYPVAWATATLLAALGGAAGMLLWPTVAERPTPSSA